MGLLDDAIREHLDLKRRRGADPADVERAEREALGPVRRNRDPGEMAAGDDLEPPTDPGYEVGDATTAYEVVDEPAWPSDQGASVPGNHAAVGGENLVAESAEAASWSATDADPAGLEPFPTAPPAVQRDGEQIDLGHPEVPLENALPDDPDREGGLSDETVEYRVPETPPTAPTAPGEEDEDVLEETPEFLQDTPDHDRLWFEQRPPRDFDFDG